jgi:hypothetical protein
VDLADSASHSGNSHQPKLPDFDDSIATRLVEQLYSFHGCTNSIHEEQDNEYNQFQDACTSLADISSFWAPGSPIPDVLSLLDFKRARIYAQN